MEELDTGSDHHLLVAEVKIKLLALKKKPCRLGQFEETTAHTGSETKV